MDRCTFKQMLTFHWTGTTVGLNLVAGSLASRVLAEWQTSVR